MNPAFLDEMSWEMAEVYGAISDQILINLARHFPFYVAGEDVPTSAFTYQAKMLAQMGQVNAETMRIIRNNLDDADLALQGALEQAVIDSVKTSQPELLEGVKRGIFAPPSIPVVAPNQYRAFKLYYQQAADKLNLVNTVMLESTQSAYRQAVSDVVSEIEIADRINRTQIAIDTAAGETVTGVSSWNQALRHACDKLNNGGITGFIDHAGRQWSAEAYVAMDIRTTVFNTGRSAVWETNQNFGNDLYLVSYHNGARPLCYPWQNKVISSTDNARTVVDLDGNEITIIAQSDTSYGAPAGLFGINCKHYPSPFIPGVSVIRGQPQNEEDNERTYEESQKQRGLERKLREQKRDYLMAKEQGRPQEELDRLREKCRNTSADIDEFCKETGRARHRDREGVYTKREFPDAKKYDVTAFEREQKDMIDGWFNKGGAQQNFTAGQMTPNVPTVPTPTTPALATSKAYTVKDATVTQQPFVVNPNSTSRIELKSADVYTMPDGKQFVFKSGMIKAHQSLTPEELIKAYYEMPQKVRDNSQNVIAVVDRYNPADSHWRKVYKNFTHSYMTGGEHITIYRHDYTHDSQYLRFSIDHEAGHFLDRATLNNGVVESSSVEWTDAMAKDKAVSGLDSMRSYGTNSTGEDFADSVAYYITEHDNFAKKMPNRTKILDRILGLGGAKP